MENDFIEKNVRARLIVAGINELEERGIRDFSLRRAALRAEVSCAAPYRHFKDKEEFISEIIKYISSKWMLLCHEVEKAFSLDKRRLIIELAVANLRFWLANANYRTVLMTVSSSAQEVLSNFDRPLLRAVEEWCEVNREDAETKKFTVRALLYGSVMMTSDNASRSLLPNLLRRELDEIF
jgi:AcrR family transcriptional regulator